MIQLVCKVWPVQQNCPLALENIHDILLKITQIRHPFSRLTLPPLHIT